MFRARVVFVLLLLTGSEAFASSLLPEGEYAITYLPQAGAKGGREELSQCLTRKNPTPRLPAKMGSCKVSNVNATGESVIWGIECSSPVAQGSGAINFGGNQLSGMVSLQPGKPGQMPVMWIVQGERTGACGTKRGSGDPEPREPPDEPPTPPGPPPTNTPRHPSGPAPVTDPNAPERFYGVEKWELQIDEKVGGELSDAPAPGQTCTAAVNLSTKGKGTLYTPMSYGRKPVYWEGKIKLETGVSENWECQVPEEKTSYSFEQHGNGTPKMAEARLWIDAKRNVYTFQLLGSGGISGSASMRYEKHSTPTEFLQRDALNFLDERVPLPEKGYELWRSLEEVPPPNMSMGGMTMGPFPRQGGYSLRPHRVRVCGPDITPALKQTLANVRDRFAKLSGAEQGVVCHNMVDPLVAWTSWDIAHLHDHLDWMEGVRPECATEGDIPSCWKSVQVDDQCFYVGSVNYVLYGVVMRLCHDSLSVKKPFTSSSTEFMIRQYKSKAPNLEPSVKWSLAGWQGWPAAPTPQSDRPKCKRECPTEYLDRLPRKPDGSIPVYLLPYLNF